MQPIILAIDTSCDETSVSLLQGDRIIVQEVSSQVKLQSAWGGVVPMLARRKHLERMEFVIAKALLRSASKLGWSKAQQKELKRVAGVLAERLRQMEKEQPAAKPEISAETGKIKSYQDFSTKKVFELSELGKINDLPIDLIAVTVGPGLAIALEVGISAAKQLAEAWSVKLASVNHMEGHLWSGLLKNSAGKGASRQAEKISTEIAEKKTLPRSLGLLVSGNHTEIVLIDAVGKYKILGQTIDDAAGEAFDKFAVMLNLGYPGGAIVEELAQRYLDEKLANTGGESPAKAGLKPDPSYALPIPMQKSGDYNFSFSGLKTAALYKVQAMPQIDAKAMQALSYAFQYSVIKSIELKLAKAVKEYKPAYVFTGGGVFANNSLRKMVRIAAATGGATAIQPRKSHVGDNASMIGLAGFYSFLEDRNVFAPAEISSTPLLDRKPSLKL